MSQLLAIQGMVLRLSLIWIRPLYKALFIQMAFWLREKAGSSELRPSSRLMLKTVFFEDELSVRQELEKKKINPIQKSSSLFSWLKIRINEGQGNRRLS